MFWRTVIHQKPPGYEPYYTNHTSHMVNRWPVKPVDEKTTEGVCNSSSYRTTWKL
jgi:hypothetical protein